MSVILEFPTRIPARAPAETQGRTAEVVIFPGVRIERREFNLADRVAKVRRKPSSAAQAEDLNRT
jgi:hypothetical protein